MKAARNYFDFFKYADGRVLSAEGLYAQTKNHYGELVEVEVLSAVFNQFGEFGISFNRVEGVHLLQML